MRSSRSSTFGLMFAALLFAITSGCGGAGDDGGTDAGAGGMADAGTSSNQGGGPSNCAGDAGNCALPADFEYDSQYEMRFTDFAFKQGTPGYNLNTALETFLDQSKEFPIVVLLHLRKIEPEAGTLEVRGGAGLKVDKGCVPDNQAGDCKYKWDAETADTYRELEIDGETGRITGQMKILTFVGTTQFEDDEVEKFTIPIKDIDFNNVFLRPTEEGDGVAIQEADIEGYITKKAADNAKVPLSSGSEGVAISAVLPEPNFDADGDGEKKAWKLRATFSAAETRIAR